MKFVIWIILLLGLYLGYQKGLFDDLVLEFKGINGMSCEDDVKDLASGQELKNALGFTFSIVKVKNIREQSRTNKSITCVGDAMLDNAQESRLLMKLY